ncbi:amino acid adenylation domain-containing protein [Paenibacillus terreus]|uniref:Amino acid adenylation domain-containing protein n=1 Tax=Paenibacillus terreus TaxID=1387834 RepID=A0ABV5B2Q7_9BACL
METGTRKSALSAAKQELFHKLLQQKGESHAVQTAIRPVSRTGHTPVSSAQKRLWFLDQLYPQNSFYNIPFLFRLQGKLNMAALLSSLQHIVSRHESLRTTFSVNDGEPVQIIHDQAECKFDVVDLKEISEKDREAAAMDLFQQEAQTPFDLSEGPLMRSILICMQPEDHIFILNIHHIVFDGWSTGVLCHELEVLYRAHTNGETSPLPALTIQYADYTYWQNEYLKESEIKRQLAYWEDRLSGELPVLQLPYDFPSPTHQTFKGKYTTFEIPSELTTALKNISRDYGATPFMAFLTIYKILLFRYTRQADLIVGTPIANRNLEELENLVGFFVNTLVIRTSVSGEMSFVDLLRQVQQETVNAYANQDVPFDMVVEAVQPERNLSGTPLFQVLFNLIDDVSLELDGLQVKSLVIDNKTSKFEMELTLVETAEGMSGGVEYSTERFKEHTITRLIEHYMLLIREIIEKPNLPISQLQFMSDEERRQLLYEWNETAVPYPDDICLHDFFVQQAQLTPDEIAVTFQDERLTYRELDHLSNGLAWKLRTYGVGPDVCVGICMNRSMEMIVAVLGVLKAGGAYVPLDPYYPQDRLIYILEDTQVPVVITQSSLTSLLGNVNTNLFLLDTIEELEASQEAPETGVGPDHILYILYTSGSTGKPKGIIMNHRPIVNLIAWQNKNLKSKHQANVLQFSTLNFDMSCHEMFSAFCNGGAVVVVDEKTRKNPERLLELIAGHQIKRLHLPYISLQQLAEAAEQMEEIEYAVTDITVSGEQLRVTPQIRNWLKKLGNCTVQNHYGPTETHVVTAYMIDDMDTVPSLPPIGKPIDNCEIYILDNHLQPVPVGVYGELYIGGICLARGYLNRDDITSDKFIPHPFSKEQNQRIYKSGDLARFLPSGDVEFLGRIDEQVKIRGFRVEPGEVEAVISAYPGIRETVVIGWKDNHTLQELAAYIVADQTIAEYELRDHMKKKLPDYMIPSIFMQIEKMPLTPSGKVSRSSLPQPKRNLAANEKVAPVTETEKSIAAIWADILGCERVGLNDHFFELGGHSLLAIKVISRIRNAFQADLPLYTIFEFPQLSDFVTQLETYLVQHESLAKESIVPVKREPYMPLSFAQERIWFFEQLRQGTSMYNISKALRIRGAFDIGALQKSCQQLIGRHEILRTNFVDVDGLPMQVIHTHRTCPMQQVNLTHGESGHQEAELKALIAKEEQRPFDLAQDPLIRTFLYRLNDDEWVLLLVMHHIIFDGWSMSVLEQDLWEIYESCKHDPAYQGEALPLQYVDYAVWQRGMLQGTLWDRQLSYWKNQLHGKLPILQLPTDRPRPMEQSYKGASIRFVMDDRLAAQARLFSQQENVSLYMTLLTAFKVLLYRYTGEQDLLVGSPMTNRNRMEWEKQIGFFINTLVIRTNVSPKLTWREVLSRVKKVAMEAFAHQDIPFEKLVQELQPERSQGFSPVFQVMFSVQNAQHDAYPTSDLHFSHYELENINSLFDLSMFVEEEREKINVTIEYAADLFEEATIERFAGHYLQLLAGMLRQPDECISQAPLLTEEERRLLEDWNHTDATYSENSSIYELFEKNAHRRSLAVAIEDGERQVTYQELHALAEEIASMLRARQAGAGMVIGIYLGRSLELVASMLGILKTGACFVPLDPEYPIDRIMWMVEDSRMPVILTHSQLTGRLPVETERIIRVDQLASGEGTDCTLDHPAVSVDQPAYVIYTSGSTGKPKGVMISQRSLADHVQSVMVDNKLNEEDRIVQFSAISFDFSIHEMFPALLAGATLVLRPKSVLDTHEFIRWLVVKRISVLYLPTAYWHLMISEWEDTDAFPPSLKLLSVGGEKASSAMYKKWRQITQGRIRWSNAYGPTETTVAATAFYDDLDPLHEEHTDIPIGRPLPNTQIYILDDLLQPVPIGVAGELYIGGTRLALGYLQQPELTAKAFITNPFRQGQRLYRTGDYVRYRPDGQVEYIGRKDSQVKIRGYRVELREIEACLEQLSGVEQALVMVREDMSASEKQLAAYVKCEDGESALDRIRREVKQYLPAYMHPSFFIALESFPVTTGGKVDRELLPKPDVYPAADPAQEMPSNETEVRLHQIWRQILQREAVGTTENFFDIGGHSLLATQVISQIRKEFAKNVPIKTIFDAPTIVELAQAVDAINPVEPDSKISIPRVSRQARDIRS